MNIPTGLMAAALLVWGWHNELLPVAAGLGLILELPRWVSWRWRLDDKDFHRVADLSSIGFVLLAIYQFDANGASGIYGILRWLPAWLFLLAAAQVYSTRVRIDYTAVFLSVRRAVARGTAPDPGGIDMRVPYLVVCLVSASGGAAHPRWLLVSLAALAVWLLAANRPARRAPLPWLATLCVALALGFALQTGFLKVRRILEPVVMDYLQKRIAARSDPYRAYTAIGHVGELKLSNRIVMRVQSEPGSGPPGLLREASYETFARNLWVARNFAFEELPASEEGTAWTIRAPPKVQRVVGIDAYMPRGKGLLAVPGGTHRLERLPVDGVYRNRLGALKVLRGPELVRFRARYQPDAFPEAPPGEADLALPSQHRSLLAGLAARLGLGDLDDRRIVEKLRQFFARDFEYTLSLRGPVDSATPLEDFLLASRRGHCEYFATSTVLLLRAAGVPARYATGYSVQEWSELENRYVVRRRHAHSWALAYVNGAWRDVDTTPVAWAAMESAEAPWWEGAQDLLSYLLFQFNQWRWSESEESTPAWLLWLIVPLVLLLFWRLRRRERVTRGRSEPGHAARAHPRQGADSAFYTIERRLAADGLERATGEPAAAWIRRLAEGEAIPDSATLLDDILPLHYRYRFHPAGLDPGERELLEARVRRWLAGYAAPLSGR